MAPLTGRGQEFADFLCRDLMIVVELDGHSHDLRPEHDAARDRWMTKAGYQVLRFTNADVQGNVEGVVTAICLVVEARTLAEKLCKFTIDRVDFTLQYRRRHVGRTPESPLCISV